MLGINVFYFDWEVKLIEFLQTNLPPFIIKAFEYITLLGEDLAIIAIVGLIYWCIDKKFGKFLALSVGACNVFYPMIKNIVVRSRPYMDVPEIRCVKPVAEGDINDLGLQGYSFPSGHAANAMNIYGSIFAKKKNVALRILMPVVILLVVVSRMVLGVHYPTDLIAGLLAGFIVIFLLQLITYKCKHRYYYIVLAVLGAAGFFFCKSTDYYTGYGILLGAMLADLFETRYVNFDNAKSFWEGALRMVGGLAIYFILNTVLKLPFSKEFLASKTFWAFFVRSARYTIIMFVDLALYPMLFKFFRKKEKTNE